MKVFVSTYPYGLHDKSPIELLQKNGFEVSFNETKRKLKPEETAELAQDQDAVIAGTEDLNPLLNRAGNLKLVSRVGIGLDSVPLKLCKQKGIAVAYTPDAVTMAVVELTIGMMLDATRCISLCDRQVRKKQWTRPIGRRIEESVVGLIGFGRVGSNVARLLSSFRPRQVLVCDIVDKAREIEVLQKSGLAIKQVSLEHLLAESHIVSMHVPLTAKTRYMLNSSRLKQMMKEAVLVNTARGPVVNEDDLFAALGAETIRAAAIDVFDNEPYTGPLRELENVTLTQHIGSCSFDARVGMEYGAAEAVVDFFAGRPLKNPVPEYEYDSEL